jgi:hypothetical protein
VLVDRVDRRADVKRSIPREVFADPPAQSDVQDLAGVRARGDQRVLAANAGVAEPGAPPARAEHLADERLDIDDRAPAARAGARRPCAREALGRHRRDERMTLPPRFAAPGRAPKSSVRSTSASIPSRDARTADSITPAFATARSSSKTTTVESLTMHVASRDGPRQPQSVATKPDLGRHLPRRPGQTVDRGSAGP